jgi:hypothetical protein
LVPGDKTSSEGFMRLVTTCNEKQFHEYAHRLFDGFEHFPQGTELWWYTEGFSLPKKDGIVQISTDKLQELQMFKTRWDGYVPPNYLYDVVRFSHKVFATVDALHDYQGIGVWIDADCVPLKTIPSGFIEGHLQGKYMAMLKRRGMYTETGFWIADCAHPVHADFMHMWAEWYRSGAFKDLANWTDCETLDATVRRFEKDGLIQTVSLSGEFDKDMHPMTKIELGKYIDHCKGARKAAGFSPERCER